MTSSCWQLNALLIKSWLIAKRNWCSTLAELLFPVFLMIILVLVRQAFPVEDKLFIDEEKSENQINESNKSIDEIAKCLAEKFLPITQIFVEIALTKGIGDNISIIVIIL